MSLAEQLREALRESYQRVDVVASTGSTNADLRQQAAQGAPDRSVLIADEQTAGAGRRSRTWTSPPGSGLYCSVLLRPAGVPAERLGALTLVAGVALVRTTESVGVRTVLKWPNDLLVPELGKCAGVLAESVPTDEGPAVVLGIGLNIAPMGEVEPGAGNLAATSLADAGGTDLDRGAIASRLLTELATAEDAWRGARGDLAASGVLEDYRRMCVTLGQQVRVELGADAVTGTARDIDELGQLILDVPGEGTRVIAAGDVVHLRAE